MGTQREIYTKLPFMLSKLACKLYILPSYVKKDTYREINTRGLYLDRLVRDKGSRNPPKERG